MAHLEALFGTEVIGKDGGNVAVSSLADKDVIGVYFSAHWCPPCRGFTPALGDCYTKVTSAGKKLEIIFVSLDRSEEEGKDYFSTMPWLLLPFDSDQKEVLTDKFGISGIPALVLIDAKTGDLITKDGRGKVQNDPNGDQFPWK
uniref:Nucleoredoxin n=1 Tax=Onchidium reevesii TaxID=2547651 RepID=A0A977KR23_9EUPU|nr:nucleoredoxin [Onchidium reevesii]